MRRAFLYLFCFLPVFTVAQTFRTAIDMQDHSTGQLVRQHAIPILFPGQQVPIALEGLVPGAYLYRWAYGSGVLVMK